MNILERISNFSNDQWSDNTRLLWLLNINILGLLAGILITSPLWSTDRDYPLSPTLRGFDLSPFTHDFLFLVVLITLTLSLFRFKYREWLLTFGLSALLILVLLDITRLQPWILHYAGILLLFTHVINRKYLSPTSVLDASRLIVSGIYFWSGIHKINPRFFTEIFPWFTEQLWMPYGEIGFTAIFIVGLTVPFIEALFALGLLTRKFRKISVALSLCMLAVVMMSIGPFGNNWNSSVWPWNFAIFAMVVALFWNSEFSFREFIMRIKKSRLAWGVIAFVWIMPAGNFVGLTDHYLSWSLYSGKTSQGILLGNQEFLSTLSSRADEGRLQLIYWAQQDLNVVPYPENRVFEEIFLTICQRSSAQPLTLLIADHNGGLGGYQKTYNCNGADY